eukprot:792970_1
MTWLDLFCSARRNSFLKFDTNRETARQSARYDDNIASASANSSPRDLWDGVATRSGGHYSGSSDGRYSGHYSGRYSGRYSGKKEATGGVCSSLSPESPGKSNSSEWASDEDARLLEAVFVHGARGQWGMLARCVQTRGPVQCRNHFWKMVQDGRVSKDLLDSLDEDETDDSSCLQEPEVVPEAVHLDSSSSGDEAEVDVLDLHCSPASVAEECRPSGSRLRMPQSSRLLLERYYDSGRVYPSAKAREKLGRLAGITTDQVRTWFQNARVRRSRPSTQPPKASDCDSEFVLGDERVEGVRRPVGRELFQDSQGRMLVWDRSPVFLSRTPSPQSPELPPFLGTISRRVPFALSVSQSHVVTYCRDLTMRITAYLESCIAQCNSSKTSPATGRVMRDVDYALQAVYRAHEWVMANPGAPDLLFDQALALLRDGIDPIIDLIGRLQPPINASPDKKSRLTFPKPCYAGSRIQPSGPLHRLISDMAGCSLEYSDPLKSGESFVRSMSDFKTQPENREPFPELVTAPTVCQSPNQYSAHSDLLDQKSLVRDNFDQKLSPGEEVGMTSPQSESYQKSPRSVHLNRTSPPHIGQLGGQSAHGDQLSQKSLLSDLQQLPNRGEFNQSTPRSDIAAQKFCLSDQRICKSPTPSTENDCGIKRRQSPTTPDSRHSVRSENTKVRFPISLVAPFQTQPKKRKIRSRTPSISPYPTRRDNMVDLNKPTTPSIFSNHSRPNLVKHRKPTPSLSPDHSRSNNLANHHNNLVHSISPNLTRPNNNLALRHKPVMGQIVRLLSGCVAGSRREIPRVAMGVEVNPDSNEPRNQNHTPFTPSSRPVAMVDYVAEYANPDRFELSMNDENPWLFCGVCSEKFTSALSLRRHQRTHAELRPFFCTTCKSRFTKRYNLWRHLRMIHKIQVVVNNVKLERFDTLPGDDDDCEKENFGHPNANLASPPSERSSEFPLEYIKGVEPSIRLRMLSASKLEVSMPIGQPSTRKRARSQRHGDKTLCRLCRVRYASKNALVDHFRQVHPSTKPWRCRFCGRLYASWYGLVRHDACAATSIGRPAVKRRRLDGSEVDTDTDMGSQTTSDMLNPDGMSFDGTSTSDLGSTGEFVSNSLFRTNEYIPNSQLRTNEYIPSSHVQTNDYVQNPYSRTNGYIPNSHLRTKYNTTKSHSRPNGAVEFQRSNSVDFIQFQPSQSRESNELNLKINSQTFTRPAVRESPPRDSQNAPTISNPAKFRSFQPSKCINNDTVNASGVVHSSSGVTVESEDFATSALDLDLENTTAMDSHGFQIENGIG